MKTNSHMRAGSHQYQPTQLAQRVSQNKQTIPNQQPFSDKTNRIQKGNQTQRNNEEQNNKVQTIEQNNDRCSFPYDNYKGFANVPQFQQCIQEISKEDEEQQDCQNIQIHSRNGAPTNIADVSSFQGSFIQHLQQQSEPNDQDENELVNAKDQQVSSVIPGSSKTLFSVNTHRLKQQDSMNSQKQNIEPEYNLVAAQKQQSKSLQRSQFSEQKKALYMKLRSDYKDSSQLNESIKADSRQNTQKSTIDTRLSTMSQNNHALQETSTSIMSNCEVEKWKKFGYLVAESYDELKKEHEKLRQEKETDKKIINALKDQVTKLKQIISARNIDDEMDHCYKELIENLQQENAQLKKEAKEKEVLQQEVSFQGDVINKLNEKLQKAKMEINQLKTQTHKGQSSSFNLAKPNAMVNQSQTSRNENNYYKKMSHQHLRECSQLADELICLRSDIDKQSMQQTVRSSSQSFQLDRRGLSNGKAWPLSIQNSGQKRNSFSANREDADSKIVSAIASPSNNTCLRKQQEELQNFTPQITNQVVNTTSKVQLQKQSSENYQMLSPLNRQKVQNPVNNLSNSKERSSKRKVTIMKHFRDEDDNEEEDKNQRTNTNNLMKIMLKEDNEQQQRIRTAKDNYQQQVQNISNVGNSLNKQGGSNTKMRYSEIAGRNSKNSEMSMAPTDSGSISSLQGSIQKQSPYTANYKAFQCKKY